MSSKDVKMMWCVTFSRTSKLTSVTSDTGSKGTTMLLRHHFLRQPFCPRHTTTKTPPDGGGSKLLRRLRPPLKKVLLLCVRSRPRPGRPACLVCAHKCSDNKYCRRIIFNHGLCYWSILWEESNSISVLDLLSPPI